MTTLTLSAGAHGFGDGSHPTTRGVLALLEAIDPALFHPARALDMGAGSGILGFAIIERFACPVVAVDLEASSIETMAENARANGIARASSAGDQGVFLLRADGFAHPSIAAHAPYDLITMNILAEPLMRLAADAEANLAPNGVLILSGMLVWQETVIQNAYQALSLELTGRVQIGDWVTLIWQKA